MDRLRFHPYYLGFLIIKINRIPQIPEYQLILLSQKYDNAGKNAEGKYMIKTQKGKKERINIDKENRF